MRAPTCPWGKCSLVKGAGCPVVSGTISFLLRQKALDARLLELARVFLKLGLVSFGGPAAHIAMMEDEVVRRRHWLTREAFLDLLGATNLIPGPNSTEMAIHIGRQRAGWAGLVVAGSCFILPAALITLKIGRAHV